MLLSSYRLASWHSVMAFNTKRMKKVNQNKAIKTTAQEADSAATGDLPVSVMLAPAPAVIDTTATESPAAVFSRDVASLQWARSVRTMSLTDYVKAGKGEDEQKQRKADWNKAKAIEQRISRKGMDAAAMALVLAVKLNGKHAIKGKAAPLDGSVAEHVAELEKRTRLEKARSILSSGCGADGIPSDSLTTQERDDLAFCAKQDGHVREPHAAALYHPKAAILSVTDKGNIVADKKAAMRWLDWRDVEIMQQAQALRDMLREETPFKA